MAVAKTSASSLRPELIDASRIAWAFGLSIALHIFLYSSFKAGQKLGWWHELHVPKWIKSARILSEARKQPPRPLVQEIPLVFVDVSQAQASLEPPKEAKYYSDKNALAANPEPAEKTTVPKIEGKNPELVKTEDVPREKLNLLEPSPPPEPPSKKPQEEEKAAPKEAPGDLAFAKPERSPPQDPGTAERSKPKTVEEAKARLRADDRLAGEKMKQDGGVERHRPFASLDTRATAFGSYDRILVQLIQNSWYGLLDEQSYASDYRGKVILQFELHHDGSLTDLKVSENSAGAMPGFLCETAVDKPKPYPKFPADMRRVVGDIRHIQFTFFYN